MFKRKKTIPAPMNRKASGPEADDFTAGGKLPRIRISLPFAKKKIDPDNTLIESGTTTLLDVLSPASADFRGREYVEIDKVLHSYLYITGYGYSTTVAGAWLSPLIEAGKGISLNFIVERQPREKVLSKIAGTTMLNRSRMRDVGDTRSDYEELDSAVAAGLWLKDHMNRNSEDFYYMQTIIEVTADDPETLERRVSAVETLCVSMDMLAKRCDFKHEQCFLSSLPLLYSDSDIERKARRNALTTGVAAAFPFASFEMCDKTGIFIGRNRHNNSACMLDLFDRAKYSNGNIAWFGVTGAGKTFGLQVVAGRLRQQGKRVFIIAPSKGYEYRSYCDLIGGVYVKWSPSSSDSYNIMEIERRTLDADSEARGTAESESLLANHISKLAASFALLKKNLTDEDKTYIDESLVECYRRFGMAFDNETLFDENGNRRPAPTLIDWHGVLGEREETKHLAVPLLRFVTGSAAGMVRETNIERGASYYVFNVSEAPEDLREFITYWAFTFCTDMAQESVLTEDVLIIDEAWILIGARSTPEIAGRVLELAKTVRGYNGILITASQDMADYLSLDGGRYGKGIMNASRIKIIMQLEENEARLVGEILNLSESEVIQITRNRRGEALLSIGQSRINMEMHASAKEYEAITTATSDIKESRKAAERAEGDYDKG